MRWTNTVEAVTDVETTQAKGQWRIGDAIRKDLSATPGVATDAIYQECASLLETKGFDRYSPVYLGRLHRTAEAFPRAERDDRYSWDTQAEAGTPDNMKQAASALRKLGKTITKYNVRWLMQEWRAKAEVERQKENQAAKHEREQAKRETAKAAERALREKDKAAKARAKEDHAAAKARANEAREREKQTAKAPAFNEDVAAELQDPGTLKMMAMYFAVTLHAKNMQNEARKAIAALEQIAEHLTPVQIREITDTYNQVIALTRNVISTATGKPLFKVHEGGAAS